MKALAALTLLALLASCSTLKPETLTNAVVAHSQFPTLSVSVQQCVADRPDVQAQITEPFNKLVDLWQSASKLEADESLIIALAGAKSQVTQAKASWLSIKAAIVDADIDCGAAVADSVARVERTFSEIETAILSNQRAVYVLQWADLLSSVVLGRRGEVVRMGG